MTATASAPGAGLWRHADFLKLWAAQAVSSFGARITREGLPWAAAMTLGGDPLAVGVLAALSRGPAFIVGLFGGGFVDRNRRRPILIAADVARAAVLASIPLAALLHVLRIEHLYVVAALVGALSVLFDIADHAYLPSLIARHQLVDGNAKLAFTESIAEIGGPGLYGVLFALMTAPMAIAVNAGTYLVSALALGAIRKPEPPPTPDAAGDAPTHIVSDFQTGLRLAWRHAALRPLLLMVTAQALFGSFYSAMYVIWGGKDLKLTAPMFGATVAVGGVASLFGAGLASWSIRRFGIGPACVVTSLIAAVGSFFIPLAFGGPVIGMLMLMVSQAIGDSFGTVGEIAGRSIRQTQVAPAYLGRVGGAFATLPAVTGVIGSILGGFLASSVIGHRETMLVASLGMTVASGLALFTPLMRLHQTEVPDDEAREDVGT